MPSSRSHCRFHHWGFALLLAGLPCALQAQINAHDDEELTEIRVTAPEATASSPQRYLLDTVDRGHTAVRRGVGYLGENIDSWLAGDTVTDKPNRSYVRVRAKQDFYEGGEREGDYSIRGHLDVPRGKKRWRLFFDTDNNDQETLASQKLLNRNTGEQVAGVSRDRSTDWFSIRHDIGLRGDLPFDTFYRFRFRTGTALPDHWRVDFEQRAWYYHSKRWGEKSQLRFTRPLDDERFIVIGSEVQYQDRYDQFELSQSAALLRLLGPQEALRYEVGALGTDEPTTEVQQYYLQAAYSRSLYKDWMIFTVTPQLAFPRRQDWEAKAGIFFNLDIYFYAL